MLDGGMRPDLTNAGDSREAARNFVLMNAPANRGVQIVNASRACVDLRDNFQRRLSGDIGNYLAARVTDAVAKLRPDGLADDCR